MGMSGPFFVICIIIGILHSVPIWHDPMDSPNGFHLNWTVTLEGTATISAPYTSNAADCPLNNHCWQFHQSSSAFYISPTINFNNISITYSVSGLGLEPQDGDQCEIFYSINSITQWNSVSITTTDTPSTHTVPLPPTTYNTIGVGIKLASISNTKGHDTDDCFFQDISLNGDPISIHPTQYPTYNPITGTSAPTNTPDPPTPAPTLHPGTAAVTLHPGTTAPTSHPGTAAPTLHPVTSALSTVTIASITSTHTIATTYDDMEGTEDDEALGLLDKLLNGSAGSVMYFGLCIAGGCIAVCVVVIIVCCCCCKKSDKSEDAIKPTPAVSNLEVKKETVPEASIKSDISPKEVDFVEPQEDIATPVEDDTAPVIHEDKYNTARMVEKAQRTNALPQDFWREESDSHEKNRVVNRWKRGMSNVVESTRDVRQRQQTRSSRSRHRRATPDVPPPPMTPPPHTKVAMINAAPFVPPPMTPPPQTHGIMTDTTPPFANAMQQVMGYRSGTNEDDSSDESIMRKQSIYQGDYDPNAPRTNDNVESDDSSLGDMLTLTEPIKILDEIDDGSGFDIKTVTDAQKQSRKKFVIMVHNEDGTEVDPNADEGTQ